MCAVSAIYDYGHNLPNDFWTADSLYQFQKMVERAKEFDVKTGQKDCEDPQKQIWIEEVKQKVVRHK